MIQFIKRLFKRKPAYKLVYNKHDGTLLGYQFDRKNYKRAIKEILRNVD